MAIHLEFSTNSVISVVYTLLGWLFVLLLLFRQYLRQPEKPVLWKALLVTLIGLICFSINLTVWSPPTYKIPFLPLGVWVVYFFMRNGSWRIYRTYAWLGFLANFIFIAVTILSIPIEQWVYPKSNISTYIANLEEAAVIRIHPSAADASFDHEQFKQQLPQLQPDAVRSDHWYQQAVLGTEVSNRSERFPYQLIGVLPKWGSGQRTALYLEQDGRGLLVTTMKQQYYFRSVEPLIVKEAQHE